jgi:alanyl-tRNA synthetase
MSIRKLTDCFYTFFTKNGYDKIEPVGLLSPLFLRTFNPSGGHEVLVPIVKNKQPFKIRKFSLIDQCFREIDLGVIGHSHHLSFLNMAVFAQVGEFALLSKEEIIKLLYEFLVSEISLNKEKIIITLFGGGEIENVNLPPDEESAKYWKKTGIIENNIHFLKGRRNFVYTRKEEHPGGPSCEIFFDRGDNYPYVNRFIEIASINMYTYVFSGGKFKETVNGGFGAGFGLERILMVLGDYKTIYEIETIAPLVDICISMDKNIISQQIYRRHINIIADHIRAISFIISNGQVIDNSPRGRILKRLIKRILSEMIYLGLDPKLTCRKLVSKIVEMNNLQMYESKILSIIENFIDKNSFEN